MLVAAVIFTPTAAVETPPRPPCGGAEPLPPYARTGASPAIQVWTRSGPGPDWSPAACTGWSERGEGVLVALAARFPHAGDSDQLLLRFGAITSLKGLRYWSVTDGGWRTLITDASALTGPDPARRRKDFTLPELRGGADLYFMQSDNRAGTDIVYRMQIRERSATRLVVAIENVTPVRKFMLTLFEAGDLQSLHFLERAGPKDWSYYGLAWASETTASMLAVPQASYVNRARAFYAHLAGTPETQP